MAKFRFLTAAEQMTTANTADSSAVVSGAEAFKLIATEKYTFMPFDIKCDNIEIVHKVTATGDIRRYAKVTCGNRTAAVSLWDKEVPIPDGVTPDQVEFGNAKQGDTLVFDTIRTPYGLKRIARIICA